MARVLPGLREHAIVPVDVVGVEPQLALLHVLLDRRALLALSPQERLESKSGMSRADVDRATLAAIIIDGSRSKFDLLGAYVVRLSFLCTLYTIRIPGLD